jgi:uncharacterized phage-associated protein
MPTALNVAKFLIKLAAAEEDPEYLCHLRLQKLLYYVQGWSLALRDKPMFLERIEAWSNGPVVRDVYPYFADHGYNSIPSSAVSDPIGLSDKDLEFIASVWEPYKVYSALSLRRMTHTEKPWLDARRGLGPAERGNKEITRQAMKDFFKAQSRAT